MKKVNVLGSEYAIVYKFLKDDEQLEGLDGYCCSYKKQIVLRDLSDVKETQKEKEMKIKETLRHEIIHAFLNESGLKWNCNVWNDSWTKNEEMIDWIAVQFPKIYEAFISVDAI